MENSVKSDAEGARQIIFVNLSGKRTKEGLFCTFAKSFFRLGYFILKEGVISC